MAKILSQIRILSKRFRANWERNFLIIIVVIAIPTIIFLPEIQVAKYRAGLAFEDIEKLDAEKRVQLEDKLFVAGNSARVTIAQIFGGLFVLFSVLIALKNAEIAQSTLRVTEEGKITDRFSKAIELLGNEKLDIRLGGIYALERVAWDSQRDHWSVMEILTAFIREASPIAFQKCKEVLSRALIRGDEAEKRLREYKVPTDIQAAITVIGRRNPKWIEQETDRQNLDFRGAVLRRAKFSFAILNDAVFFEADLSRAEFYSTELKNARFSLAILEKTSFSKANISGAGFYQTKDLWPEFLLKAIRDEQTKFDSETKAQLEQLESHYENFATKVGELLTQKSKETDE